MVLYIFIGLLILGAYSIFHLLKAFLFWEIRWDLRLVRLVIHSALLGAAATIATLFFTGILKL